MVDRLSEEIVTISVCDESRGLTVLLVNTVTIDENLGGIMDQELELPFIWDKKYAISKFFQTESKKLQIALKVYVWFCKHFHLIYWYLVNNICNKIEFSWNNPLKFGIHCM